MGKFKVGDIVRAKKREGGREYYGITNSNVVCKVVDVCVGIEDKYIRVVVIGNPHREMIYNVNPAHFRYEYNRSE